MTLFFIKRRTGIHEKRQNSNSNPPCWNVHSLALQSSGKLPDELLESLSVWTKKITGKKQRKLSKVTDPQIQAEQNDGFIKDAYLDNQQTQVALTEFKPVPAQPN